MRPQTRFRAQAEDRVLRRRTTLRDEEPDFPEEALSSFDISARHPDEFLLDQLDLYPGVTISCLRHQVARYKRGRMRVAELLGVLTAAEVPAFADEVRRHLPPAER